MEVVSGRLHKPTRQTTSVHRLCVRERESECVAHCLFASVCMKILVSN